MKHYSFIRLQDLLFFCIFFGVILLGPRLLNTDGDLPRHLAMGRYIIQNRVIPITDIFSHTVNGLPFAPHEWLAGVVFYITYYYLGLNGIVILSAILIASTFEILYLDGVKRTGQKLIIFILVIFGAMISSLHWIARPHLFTMLFLAIWLVLVERLSKGQNIKIWIFPVLMLFWTNTHGEFIVGLLIIGTYLLGWLWDDMLHKNDTLKSIGYQLGLAGLLSLIATIINPAGLRIWTTVIGYVNNKYLTSHTVEYNPPNFLEPKYWVFLAFILLSIVVIGYQYKRTKTSHFLMLVGFCVMALVSARNIHLFGVVGPFALATILSGSQIELITKPFENFIRRVEIEARGFFWPIAIILVFIFGSTLGAFKGRNQFDPAIFPVNAVTWLKMNSQPGNMFNYFNWGGYLLLNLWPEKLVFIDGQTDVYGEAVTRQYEKVLTLSPGWMEVFIQYQIDWVIMPTKSDIINVLINQGWREVFRDETAVVIVK